MYSHIIEATDQTGRTLAEREFIEVCMLPSNMLFPFFFKDLIRENMFYGEEGNT